jgi:hypothetical protein
VTGIEDVLREALAEQLLAQPSLHDPAGRAIDGARTVRRRRVLIGSATLAIVVVLVAAGLPALRARGTHPVPLGPATPTGRPSTSMASLPLAVFIDQNRLLIPDRGAIDFGTRTAGFVYQVNAGWLVVGGSQDWLTLVTPDGVSHDLLTGLDAVVVAADGEHLAWQAGNQLKTGHLNGTKVAVDHSTTTAGHGFPFAMTDTAVVLADTWTGGGYDRYDVWLPDRGPYAPSWDQTTANVAWVFAPAPDGHSFLGLTLAPGDSKGNCLALLDPTNYLKPVRTACGLNLTDSPPAQVSADGRWLCAGTLVDGSLTPMIFDLGTVFQEPRATQRCAAPGYWLDATTMVAKAGDQVIRIHVGDTVVEQVGVPGIRAGAHYDLVPPPNGARHSSD